MNTDIRLSINFWTHPKTVKLERRLGLEGVRSLQILWLWAARNRADGRLHKMDAEAIEIAADWRGEAGKFVTVLEELGWLDVDEDECRVIHDWQDHNGWAADADKRSDESRFLRLFRENGELARRLKERGVTAISREQYRAAKSGDHAVFADLFTDVERGAVQDAVRHVVRAVDTDVERGAVQDAVRDAIAPAPAPAPAPGPVPVPAQSALYCAELQPAAGDSTPDESPVVHRVPLIPKDGEYLVTRAMIDAWQKTYPGIDVGYVCGRIVSWCQANPGKRKTRRGAQRFIDNWLAREQDKGGASGKPADNTPKGTNIGGYTFPL